MSSRPRPATPVSTAVCAAALALLGLAACGSAAPPASGPPTSGPPPEARAAGGYDPAPIDEPRLLNDPEITREATAIFPSALREAGTVTGHVVVRARVLEDGSVDPESVVPLEASKPAFAEPARTLARRMRFAPAKVGGRTVPVWIRHEVAFRATDASFEGTYEVPEFQRPVLRDGGEVPREIEARYPPALRQAGVGGSVLVRFKVLEDGTVDSTAIVADVATDPRFEEPAIAVVRGLRFTPATAMNRVVPAWTILPIHFGPVPAGGAQRDAATSAPARD